MSRRRIILGLLLTGLSIALLAVFVLIMLRVREQATPAQVDSGQVEGTAASKIDLEQLLADYRTYGLPLPPKDAKLVKLESGWRHHGFDGKETPIYLFGFLIQPGNEGRPAMLLVGTQEHQPEDRNGQFRTVEPSSALVKEVESEWMNSKFPINAGLATAIQCKARGWDELAQALLAASLRQDAGHRNSGFYQPANLPPKTALAHLAWAHWANELIKPDTDRAVIAEHIQLLLDANQDLSTWPNRSFLQSLQKALQPSAAKPGSVAALIDDLVESTYIRGRLVLRKPDPRYQRLLEKGLDAVPALIEHLEDQRLTRGLSIGFHNFPTYHLRVQDIVSDLLQELAGQDLGKDWLRRTQAYPVTKADALAWWEKVKNRDEEAYALEGVLPAGAKAPSDAMLRIIVDKYPKHLPKLYRTVLDQRPEMQSAPIATAITASSLPRATKLELFIYAAKHKDLEHRRAGLWELKELDQSQFVTLLVETLNSLPKTPKRIWERREASFANLVMETDDPRAWDALTRFARECHVGLRTQLLEPMSYLYIGERQRRQRLDFLAQFLDDAQVRDVESDPDFYDWRYHTGDFPRIEVRNHAARQIAHVLKLSMDPQPDWTAEQWAKLRAQVREALRLEAEKSKKKAPREANPKRGQ